MIFCTNRRTRTRVIIRHDVDKIKISESGIDSVKAIQYLKKNGFSGFLMGEKFMKEKYPQKAFEEFVNELNQF